MLGGLPVARHDQGTTVHILREQLPEPRHGIGIEEHEDPYVVAGNCTALVAGHAFSVEPGIYVPGEWGARLEDIVVAADAGPDPLNRVDHGLAVVEA